jgi:tetratricopeptide (TPR) repeat protein
MKRHLSILLLSAALALSGCSAEPPMNVAEVERAIAEHRYHDAQTGLVALRDSEGRSPQTAELLAQVMIALGDGYAAERYLTELRTDGEQTAQWTIMFAQAMILQGRSMKAREVMAGFAGKPPADGTLAWLQVWAAMELGETAEAEALVTEALATYPQSADLHAKAARLALWQDDAEQADSHIAQALTADSRHYEALLLSGERMIASGDLEGALQPYQTAAKYYPDYAVPRANVVGLLLDLGRLEEAKPVLDEALQRQPDFALLRFNAARLQAMERRWDEARRTLQSIPSAWTRDFPAAIMLQAEVEAGLGNYGMARTLYLSLADNPAFGAQAAALMAELPAT